MSVGRRVEWSDPDETAAALRALQPTATEGGVSETVAEVIERVRTGGDSAVIALEGQFGNTPQRLRVPQEEMAAAESRVPGEVLSALRLAEANVRAVAESELVGPRTVDLAQGQVVELRDVPFAAVGAYAPGGGGSYPSTIVMEAVPASVAGVERTAVTVPAGQNGTLPDVVLAACSVVGVSEVYSVGGAQAIAMLALGTESVERVDFVCGPGNRYVQEAKRQLVGEVGIDGIAGPSELAVIIDSGADPDWAALDLCAQAEHGADGLVVVISWDQEALEAVLSSVTERLDGVAEAGSSALGAVLVPDRDEAVALANALAPEHLELVCGEAAEMAPRIRAAGCVLVGPYGATAFGDYMAGSNHVLPTGGAGRFSGPLGPREMMRSLATVSVPQAAARELAGPTATLARAEGFEFHARSAAARGRQPGSPQ